jgi:hypothetical protein
MADKPQHTHPLTDAVAPALIAACPRCAQIRDQLVEWEWAVVQLFSGIPLSTLPVAEREAMMSRWRPILDLRSRVMDVRVGIWRSSGMSMENFLAKYPPQGNMDESIRAGYLPHPDPNVRPWTAPWEPEFQLPSRPSSAMEHNHPLAGVTAGMMDACPRCRTSQAEHGALLRDAVQLFGGTDFASLPEEEQASITRQWREKFYQEPGPSEELVYRWRASGLSRTDFMQKRKANV